MLSAKTKRNIYRIIPFGIIYLVFTVVFTQIEKGLLGDLKYYPTTGNPYNATRNIYYTPIIAFITGSLIGLMEVTYFNKLFMQKSLTKKIVYKSIIYLSIIISFILCLGILNSIGFHASILDKQMWHKTWTFFSNLSFWSLVLYMGSIIIVTQFYLEVSDNIGFKVLNNFLTGKYHSPKEEERIFMFLDMRSSTTIAEILGHTRYFEMLKEYYSDLSDPIIEYSGEIYQYVGDEIIVSWNLKNGLENNNCIQCFFAIQSTIQKQAPKYLEKYKLVPEFKAGFHLGKVTTGEIGVLKKEIIFTGDVLNTAARIQELCKIFEVDILVSGNLIKRLNAQLPFKVHSFGEKELRGRGEKVELFTIALDF